MSKEHNSDAGASPTLSHLVCALIEELADEVPDDPKLETVRADLLAACRTYESGKKKDVALRFYLATRSLLREYEQLQERLRKAEKKIQADEPKEEQVHTMAAESTA